MTAVDVVAVGEALLRLSVPPGRRLETATSFDIGVGGAELNVAVGVARMGRSAAWVGRLPRNPHGTRVAAEAARHGVDLSGVTWVDDGRLGTYYLELAAAPRSSDVVYDREHSVGAGLSATDVDWDLLATASVVHLTGITPALSPSCRELVEEVAEWAADQQSVRLLVDVNHRRKLWPPDEAADVMEAVAQRADVVIINEEDAGQLFGETGSPEPVTRSLSERFGGPSVVATFGSGGACWVDGEDSGHVPSLPVEIVDPIGAGDAFAAGVALGLLDGDLASGVRTGSAMAALTLGAHGDQFQFEPSHVRAALASTTPDVNR